MTNLYKKTNDVRTSKLNFSLVCLQNDFSILHFAMETVLRELQIS